MPWLRGFAAQIPGYIESADMTQTLERGYWPSYNVPVFRDVYNRSGYPELRSRLEAAGPGFEEAVSGAARVKGLGRGGV